MTFFVLASGPSLCREDIKAVRTRRGRKDRTIAVNTTFRAAPWADYLYAADWQWWDEHEKVVCCLDSERVSLRRPLQNPAVDREIEYRVATGLGHSRIHTGTDDQTPRGGNSGLQAINLAFLLGAREIVLLGFDCGHTYGRRHWHGDHPEGLGNAQRPDLWAASFPKIARDLAEAGVKVWNCSRETRLDCFDRLPLHDWFERYRGS